MKGLSEHRQVAPIMASELLRSAAQALGQPVGLEPAKADGGDYRRLSTYSTILIAARRDFGGDLDRLAVYLVFAMSELSRRVNGGEGRGVNALSVADITYIPRETVRRKLRELASAGDLRLGDDGLWYIADTVRMERLIRALRRLMSTAAPISATA